MFAFRILVDIALKALSPAINDPTTAVLALDQVHRLLRVVGKRQLRGEASPTRRGRPRVIFRTPNWEDFVMSSCTEIRACGANNVQIARRLRAMLDESRPVAAAPPASRVGGGTRPAGSGDRAALHLPGDLALARIPISGLGGSATLRNVRPKGTCSAIR